MAQSPRQPSSMPTVAVGPGRCFGSEFRPGRCLYAWPRRTQRSRGLGAAWRPCLLWVLLGRLLSLAPLPQCLCLSLGLAGQTFHLFFVLPPLPGAALHSPGHRPCWVEPLRAPCESILPHPPPPPRLNTAHSQPATSRRLSGLTFLWLCCWRPGAF